jgi:hypothetical protein
MGREAEEEALCVSRLNARKQKGRRTQDARQSPPRNTSRITFVIWFSRLESS